MVELQQETIVHMEKTTEGVVHDLEKGTRHVSVTVTRAKITRKVLHITESRLKKGKLTVFM